MPYLDEQAAARPDFLVQLYADEILRAASADHIDELHVEIAALRQIPPFRYVDRLFETHPEVDGVLGWVEFKAEDDRLYDQALSGTFLLEALAQLSGLLIRRLTRSTRGGVLAAIERAVFASEQPDRHGILLHVQLKSGEFPLYSVEGTARQSGRILCACSLTTRINTGDE